MPHPFDATLKELGANSPAGLLTLFDAPPEAVAKVLSPDLSTVTASTDLVIGLGDPPREIIHFDFQSSANAEKGRDVLAYNALLHRHYKVPFHSVLLLLRPSSAHSEVVSACGRWPPRICYVQPSGCHRWRCWASCPKVSRRGRRLPMSPRASGSESRRRRHRAKRRGCGPRWRS